MYVEPGVQSDLTWTELIVVHIMPAAYAKMRERMDATTPERNEYEHRYKDNQVEGVLRDPIEKEKGLWDRSVDPADNRVNAEPSYREDQVALMWYTGTFKDGASELSVERIQVDDKTSIPYIGNPENSLPINVRPGCDYLGASWLYTKVNLSSWFPVDVHPDRFPFGDRHGWGNVFQPRYAFFDYWTAFQKGLTSFPTHTHSLSFSLSLSLSNISLSSPLSHNAPQIRRTPPHLSINHHWASQFQYWD
jgi:hypothetical protein